MTQILQKRIDDRSDIEEISMLQKFFNKMLIALEHQFFTDHLTGLSNRRMLLDKSTAKQFSHLALINIDRFQEVNNFYGQDKGDMVLLELSKRLRELSPDYCIVFKLNSDEFAILDTKILDFAEFMSLIKNVINNINNTPFQIGEYIIHISITSGIAKGRNRVLSNADVALKMARKEKKDLLVYDNSMLETAEYEENINILKQLRWALENNKIINLYQPIVNRKTCKIEKYESLVRLIDEEGNIISPVYFLSIAKKARVYTEITRRVVINSFEKFKNSNYEFSINLSVEDILDKELVKFIKKKIGEYNIGNRVVFEIVESEGIENFQEINEFITEVKH